MAANQIAPLDEFFEFLRVRQVLPLMLLFISKDGKPYSVPVNIHRSNVMWYNPAVLAEAGVELPTTMDEFFAACETLERGRQVLPGPGPAMDSDAPAREHHDWLAGCR